MLPNSVVVAIGLRLEADIQQYRVECSIETKAFGKVLYERRHAFFGTWAEVVTWLQGQLSTENAQAAVSGYFS